MAPTRNSNIISLTLKYVDFDIVSSSTKELGSHSHFVWYCYRSRLTTSCRSTESLLLELLSVKFGYFSISCLSKDDVAYVIDFMCTC